MYIFINWLPGIFNSKVISGSQYPLLFLFKTLILMCTSGKIKFVVLNNSLKYLIKLDACIVD